MLKTLLVLGLVVAAAAAAVPGARGASRDCRGKIEFRHSIRARKGGRLLGVLEVRWDAKRKTTCAIVKRRGTVKDEQLFMSVTLELCFTGDPKKDCGDTGSLTKKSSTVHDYYERRTPPLAWKTAGHCIRAAGSVGTVDGKLDGSAFTALREDKGRFCNG